jgi:hypothetical protein
MTWIATSNALEIAMQLCPGFLEKIDPELLVAASCKHRFFVSAGQVIIKDDSLSNAIDIKIYQIASSCIDFLFVKQCTDVARIFCHRAEYRQEIAVT